jgi:hypothetical protein
MRAADVQKLIAAETEKWAKVIKFFRGQAGLIPGGNLLTATKLLG